MIPSRCADGCLSPRRAGGCGGALENRTFVSLEEIVTAYQSDKLPQARAYLRFYRQQSSLTDAIEAAGMAVVEGGKRFAHQRLIPRATLRRLTDALHRYRKELQHCRSFSELHERVASASVKNKGIGPLTIYDTAHRLGAYLKLRPQVVYLHAGVRRGVRALGLDHRGATLPKKAFPIALRVLSAEQIEDCLCIYKAALVRLSHRRPLGR